MNRIRVVGNHDGLGSGQNDSALRTQMNQRQSPLGFRTWPLSLGIDGSTLDEDRLQRDVYALEVYLARRGYYDAAVSGFAVGERRPRRGKRSPIVDITVHVTLGEPVTIPEGPDIRWSDAPAGRDARELRRLSYAGPDAILDLDEVQWTADALVRHLEETGFPHPVVTPSVDVFPGEHSATVVFDVRSGRPATFGPPEITGAVRTRPSAVLGVLRLPRRGPWDVRRLEESERALYQTGAFERVHVEAAGDGTSEREPIGVEVAPRRPRSLTLTAGFEWSNLALGPDAGVRYTNADVRGRLARFDAWLSVGGRWRFSVGLPVHGDLGVSHWIPAVGGSAVGFGTGVRAKVGMFQDAVGEATFETHAGTRIRLARGLTLESRLAINARVLVPIDDEQSELLVKSLIGVDPGAGYLARLPFENRLSYRVDHGAYDDPDWAFGASVGWTQSLLLGTGTVELNGVVPLSSPSRGRSPPVVLGLRARAALVHGFDPYTEAYYVERLFLGGPDDLRGFRQGGVGTYDCVCLTDGLGLWRTRRSYLPRGGLASALVSGELRWRRVLTPELSLVAFGDAGALSEKAGAPLPASAIRWDAGVGWRYGTPIGALRMDVAARPIFPEDLGRDGDYLGCETSGEWRRAFDIASEFRRGKPLSRTFPAINVVFGIGQAF